MYTVTVNKAGQTLSIQTQHKTVRYHAIWLRDNAPDENTRSPANGQRLITLKDIPEDTSIQSAQATDERLVVTFSPENVSIVYSIPWLIEHSYDQVTIDSPGYTNSNLQTWGAELMSEIPQAEFDAVAHSTESLRVWLSQLSRYGFAKLIKGPVEDQALMQVANLFGYVRETNYGKHFEVRTEVNATNLAYTGLGLQAHTDNPYRDPAPTMQILYCLESTAAGGENMVVDGFKVAQRLRDEDKALFNVLTQYCANFEYAGEQGVCLQASRPMIELGPGGELMSVRFNNRSVAALTEVPFDKMPLYYAAYRRMSEIIDDPSMEVSFRLNPGECFVVDNTRVLHARKSYSGTGVRWLQGCYVDKDGLQSTLSCLESQAKDKRAI